MRREQGGKAGRKEEGGGRRKREAATHSFDSTHGVRYRPLLWLLLPELDLPFLLLVVGLLLILFVVFPKPPKEAVAPAAAEAAATRDGKNDHEHRLQGVKVRIISVAQSNALCGSRHPHSIHRQSAPEQHVVWCHGGRAGPTPNSASPLPRFLCTLSDSASPTLLILLRRTATVTVAASETYSPPAWGLRC